MIQTVIEPGMAPKASDSLDVLDRAGLVMRIRGGQYDGHLVRLSSRKCSVGASRSCTLQLVSLGCHPVHCVIVRGQSGTIVRRWSPDTRLNGQDFLDSWLVPGDRLEIGPHQLEILSDQLSTADSTSPRVADPPHETAWQPHTVLQESRQTNRRRVQRLVRQIRRSAARIGRLHVELETQQQQVRQLSDEIKSLEQRLADREEQGQTVLLLEDSLTQIQERLADQRRDSDHQQQVWLRHCHQVMQLLQLTQDELGVKWEQGDCAPVIAELTQRLCADRSQSTAAHLLAEQELETRRQRLDEQFQQLLEQQQHLFRMEQELETQRRELESVWQQRLAQADQAAIKQRDEFEATRANWEQHRSAIDSQLTEQRHELQSEWLRLADERATLEDAAARVKSATEQEQPWVARVADLQAELGRVKSEQSQANAQMDLLEAERLELVERSAALQDRLQELQALGDAAELRKQVEQLQTELGAKEQARRADSEQAALQAGQLRHQIIELESVLATVRADVAAAAEQESARKVDSDVEELETRCLELEDELQSLYSDREHLQLALVAAEQQLATVRREQDEFAAEHERLLSQSQSGSTVDREELHAMLQERNQLQEQLEQLMRRVYELEMVQTQHDPPHAGAVDALSDVAPVGLLGDEREPVEYGRQPVMDPGLLDRAQSGAVSGDWGTPTVPLSDLCQQLDSRGSQTPAESFGLANPAAVTADPGPWPTAAVADSESEVAFLRPRAEAPVDTQSILARFSFNLDAPNQAGLHDEPVDSDAPPRLAQLAPTLNAAPPPTPSKPSQEDDGCIESYMAELMRRVGAGPVSSPSRQSADDPPVPVPSAKLTRASAHADGWDDAADSATSPLNIDSLKPRAKTEIDLTAMRDVANQSARCDIERHSHRQGLGVAYVKWTLSLLATSFGSGLVYMSRELRSAATWGAVAAFVIAAYWAYEGTVRWIHISRQPRLAGLAADGETDTERDASAP